MLLMIGDNSREFQPTDPLMTYPKKKMSMRLHKCCILLFYKSQKQMEAYTILHHKSSSVSFNSLLIRFLNVLILTNFI